MTLLPPDVASTIGNVLSFDGFVDENGREFPGLAAREDLVRPWIVSPMYTRCPNTCAAVTVGLRQALGRSGLAPSDYHVVSLSFDPKETADGLREFRARMQLPADWLTVRARDPEGLERALKALDLHTMTVGNGEFEHPNLLVALAPDRRVTGYLFGTNFSPDELARLVRRARNGLSPVDWWRPYLLFFAAVGFLASALLLAVLLSRRRKATRRALVPVNPSKPGLRVE